MRKILSKYLSKLVLITLLLCIFSSCGKITVEGNPTMTVQFDMNTLTSLFYPYCQELLAAEGNPAPTTAQIQSCASVMTADFIAKTQNMTTVMP